MILATHITSLGIASPIGVATHPCILLGHGMYLQINDKNWKEDVTMLDIATKKLNKLPELSSSYLL